MPKISVIVPVYNVEKYLHRCVDSILVQTFSDFELILVDDGSPDNCGRICDEYAAKDQRVRVIHKENGGVSKARNAALDIAQGTYVAFCDSDDYWNSDFLKTAMDAMNEASADVVVMNYVAVNESEEKIQNTEHCTGVVKCEQEADKYEYIYDYLINGKHGWEIWTRLFSNRIIQENNIRFCIECGDYAEDLGFVAEYSLYSQRVSSIPEGLYHYRSRMGSMMQSSKNSVKLDQVNQVSYHIFEEYMDVIKTEEYRKRYAVLHFLILYSELRKIIGTEWYAQLGEKFYSMRNSYWCKKKLGELVRYRRLLQASYGKRKTGQILLLAHYCCHGNWKRFCYESAIAYRWLIAKE